MATDLHALNARVPSVRKNPGRKALAQSALRVPSGRARNALSVHKLQTGLIHPAQIGQTGRIDQTAPTARVQIGLIAPTDLIGQTVPTGRVPIVRIDLIGLIAPVQTGPTDRIVQTGPTDRLVQTGQIGLTDRTGLIDQTVLIGRIDRIARGGTTTATVTAITGSSVVASTASNGVATGIRTATVTGGGTTDGSAATAA